MTYGATTLHDALRQRGLDSRKYDTGRMAGRVLTQDGRDIGRMTAQVGWCLVRLYDEVTTEDCPRHVVTIARRLLAGGSEARCHRVDPGMGNITERSDFDEAFDDAFPKVRRHRQEYDGGWVDSFKLGLLRVSVRVTTGPLGLKVGKNRRQPMGTAVAIIEGLRSSIDGSATPLWRRSAVEYDGLVAVLADLRAELLGLAHAITVGAGRKKKERSRPPEQPMTGEHMPNSTQGSNPRKIQQGSMQTLESLWDCKPVYSDVSEKGGKAR